MEKDSRKLLTTNHSIKKKIQESIPKKPETIIQEK